MTVRNQLTTGQIVAKTEGQGSIGHLFWYSIQHVKISREELEQKMQAFQSIQNIFRIPFDHQMPFVERHRS